MITHGQFYVSNNTRNRPYSPSLQKESAKLKATVKGLSHRTQVRQEDCHVPMARGRGRYR